MNPCSPTCPKVCDFCIWYQFNGSGWHNAIFDGDGYCTLNGDAHAPEDECENFVCECATRPKRGNWGERSL